MKSDHLSQTILNNPDVVLIGGGIMSATLGLMLRRLHPEWTIQIIEGLPRVAQESSNAWNNAGTGHAALCELNYTKQNDDGSVDISKALDINEAFEQSKQFWSFLTHAGVLPQPEQFIQPIPHMSFVWGDKNQDFLKKQSQLKIRLTKASLVMAVVIICLAQRV